MDGSSGQQITKQPFTNNSLDYSSSDDENNSNYYQKDFSDQSVILRI